jgi:hypothetical protein
MKHEPLFSSTARPPTTGTLAQVKEYWRETWPDAMDARLQPRRAMAVEMFPHLALDRPAPTRTATASAASVAAPKARTSKAQALRPSPADLHAPGRGTFFSEREAARGATSPLDGRVKGGW